MMTKACNTTYFNYHFLHRDIVTTGSILHINQDSDEVDLKSECHADIPVDTLGQPVPSFAGLSELLVAINDTGYVKKKIIEEGGGLPLHEGCTVSIAFSGYWENEPKPFDMVSVDKPMVIIFFFVLNLYNTYRNILTKYIFLGS